MSKAANEQTPSPQQTPAQPPKTTGDIELTGVRYNSIVSGNGFSGVALGQNYATGLTLSGIIKRLTLLANSGGVVRMLVDIGGGKERPVLLLPTGACCEVAE